MNLRFIRNHEVSSHLYTLGAKHKCRRDSSSIGNTARCDDRDIHCIYDLRYKYHCRILTDVSARLCTLCNKCIGSASLHTLCKRNRCDDRDNLDSGFFPHLHVFLRRTRACRNDFHAFLHDNFCHIVRVRTHEHDIHSKWLVSEFLRLSDLFTHPVSRRTRSTDQSQAAGFGYGGCKMILSNPGHSSLNDRIFNS